MSTKLQEWQEEGFSGEEIFAYLQTKVPEWRAVGFSEEEIQNHLGMKKFESEDLKELLLGIADSEIPEWRQAPDPGKGFFNGIVQHLRGAFDEDWETRVQKSRISMEIAGRTGDPPSVVEHGVGVGEAAKLGLQSSVSGLIYRDRLPESNFSKEVFDNLPLSQRLASQVGTLAGDLPFLLAGGVLGAGGGPVTSMAGAFGLTEGLRRVYLDKIEKGEITSAKEFVHRLDDALWETMKGMTVGAAVGMAGAGSTGLKALAKEVPTLAAMGAAMEGRLPESKEFLDAAIILVGLRGVKRGAEVLREHWAQTGQKPSELVQEVLDENQGDGRMLPYLIFRDRYAPYKPPRPGTMEELLGTKKFQKPKVFSGEPEPYGGPLTPEQRYLQLKEGNRGITAREMAIQDIADEGIGKIQGWKEGDRPWNVRERLQKIVKENWEKREPPKVKGIEKAKERELERKRAEGRKKTGEIIKKFKEGREKVEVEPVEPIVGDPEGLGKQELKKPSTVQKLERDRLFEIEALETILGAVSRVGDPTTKLIERFGAEKGTRIKTEIERIFDEEGKYPKGDQAEKILTEVEGLGKKEALKFSVVVEPEGIFVLPKDAKVPRLDLEGAPINPHKLYKLPYFAIIEETSPGRFDITEVNVAKNLRRKGIATEMYQVLAREVERRGGKLYKGSEETRTKLGKYLVEGLEEKGLMTEEGEILNRLLNSEDGFLDLGLFVDGLRKTKDLGKFLLKELPFLLEYPYYSGKEGLKELQGLRSRLISMPYWRAQKDPVFEPYFKIMMLGDEVKSEIGHQFLSKVSPLFKLKGEDYKGYRKITLRSDKENFEYETLKQYTEKTKDVISEKAFEAYKTVRGALDEALEFQVNYLRRTGVDPEDLQSLISEIGKIKGYFPRVREGKYYVDAEKEGEPRVRGHYKNEAELRKLKKGLEEEGYTIVEQGEIPIIPEELYSRVDTKAIDAILDIATEDWDSGLRKQLFREVSEVIKGRGFLARGIKRGEEYVKGFEEENLKRVVIQHFLGMSGMLSKAEKAKKFREQFSKDFSEGKLSNAQKREISKYVTDMLRPTTGAAQLSAQIRGLLFAKYMWLSLKSYVVNLSGNFTAAAPRLSLETEFAFPKITKAMGDIVAYTAKKDISLVSVEEARALRLGLQKGWTQDMYTQELIGQLRSLGVAGHRVGRILGGGMTITEKWVRGSTLLAAFRVFRKEKGMNFEDALEASKKVVLDAHGLYGKSNLPGLFRGGTAQDLARTAYTFRTYTHNWLNLASKMAREDRVALAKSVAAIFLLAGLSGTPFYKSIEAILVQEGINPRSAIKEWAEELGEKGEKVWKLLLYGLPGVLGIDLGGSIGIEVPGQRAVSTEGAKGAAAEAAIDLMGVPTSIVEDTFSAAEQLYYGDLGRAIEESPITPVALSNYLAGSRMEKEGLVTRKGDVIRGDLGMQIKLSKGEAALKKFGGFQPVTASEAYRTRTAQRAEVIRWNKEKDKLKVRYKKAVPKYGLASPEVTEIAVKIALLNAGLPSYIAPIDTGALLQEMLPIKPVTGREFLLQQEVR